MTMERKFTLNLDQVRRFEGACARSGLELRHVMWMLTGDNMRSVKSLADGKVEPVSYAKEPLPAGNSEWETIKVGKGKDLAIAMQIAHEGKSQPNPRYVAEVDSSLSIVELAQKGRCLISPTGIDIAEFPYAHEGKGLREFALIEVTDPDFSGLSGANDVFVLSKFKTIRIRPATFLELLSFGAHVRKLLGDEWYWGKAIVALGSREPRRKKLDRPPFLKWLYQLLLVKKKFRKPSYATVYSYPCLDCGGGRDFDAVRLTACDDAPWPSETHLFLGVHL